MRGITSLESQVQVALPCMLFHALICGQRCTTCKTDSPESDLYRATPPASALCIYAQVTRKTIKRPQFIAYAVLSPFPKPSLANHITNHHTIQFSQSSHISSHSHILKHPHFIVKKNSILSNSPALTSFYHSHDFYSPPPTFSSHLISSHSPPLFLLPKHARTTAATQGINVFHLKKHVSHRIHSHVFVANKEKNEKS